jgi:hypothetical protein
MTAAAALSAALPLLFAYDSGSMELCRQSLSTAPLPIERARPMAQRGLVFAGGGVGSNDLSKAIQSTVHSAAVGGLESFRGLPDDWDAQGAAAPSEPSIDAALLFLRYGNLSGNWDATLHADGRAILESEAHSSYVELTFGPANQVTVVSRLPGREPTVRTVKLEDMLQTAPARDAA